MLDVVVGDRDEAGGHGDRWVPTSVDDLVECLGVEAAHALVLACSLAAESGGYMADSSRTNAATDGSGSGGGSSEYSDS